MARTRIVTSAISDTNLIVGGATVAALALGRFVVLPYHRASLAKAGIPKQNGVSHFEAGDRLAEEVTFLTNTNDPAGFTIVDVFAWGALGHAAAFYILVSFYELIQFLRTALLSYYSIIVSSSFNHFSSISFVVCRLPAAWRRPPSLSK